ncbi:MAG TPA: hypothetical protein VFF73_05685 [Planctomycetota bacterium]|nr:hypothetical protein [Planctomycetota bacterium]
MRKLALLLVFVLASLAHGQDPARAQDIVLGFFNKTLGDGTRHNLVEELQQAKGGLEYFEWDQMGFPKAEYGTWDARRVWNAMDLTAKTGHRIQFNVTGMRFGTGGDKDALLTDDRADAGSVGYTRWEIAQVMHHRAFFDATDFYLRKDDGTYRKLAKKDLERLGVRYMGPELEKLDGVKGKLLRRSPTEVVYAVKGEKDRELVVELAPSGESAAERDSRAEGLFDQKAALEALAKNGVTVASRYQIGTLDGELAYVRDAVTSKPRTVEAGDTTLELSKNGAGDTVVSEIRSSRVRFDAEVGGTLASAASEALAAKPAAKAAAPARSSGIVRAFERGSTGASSIAKDRIRSAADPSEEDAVER